MEDGPVGNLGGQSILDDLTFTSCQAPIAEFFCRDLTHFVGSRLQMETRYIGDCDWQTREAQLDQGEIDVGWICGAPYVSKKDEQHLALELLVAPVMTLPRYANRPIYFSDVVVRTDSPYQTFEDLRGARWAYNEPHSHSGYHVVRYALAQRGLNGDFFGERIASGAHQTSVQMILRKEAEASAIDSTVLELMSEDDPSLCERLRIIETLGPSPIPPYVVGTHVPFATRERLRSVMTQLHFDDEARPMLARARIARFAIVTDKDYDPIREMLRVAVRVTI